MDITILFAVRGTKRQNCHCKEILVQNSFIFLFCFTAAFLSCLNDIRNDLVEKGREGNGTPLQYSCLENPMDGGAWKAALHGVAKSRTRLRDFTFTFHFHALEKEMATHSSVLAWRIPGTGSLVGCHLWGRTELDTTEAT